MQRLTLLQFLSGLLLTAAFPQHTSSRHRRDLQILTPPTDQSQPLYPSLSEPYPLAAHQFEPSPEFLLSSSFPPDTTLSTNNPPSILNPEPSIDTIYCNDKKVLVCCPQQISGKYRIPDNGFLPLDCRLAAQYGAEFGKYPCRCCGGFFGAVEALKGNPLGSNCVDVTHDAEGSGENTNGGSGGVGDGGREENDGSW